MNFQSVKKKHRKKHYCHLCEKVFTFKGHYVTHLKNVHNTNEESVDMKTVQCQKCPFKFFNNHSLKLHETKIPQNRTSEKKIHDFPPLSLYNLKYDSND